MLSSLGAFVRRHDPDRFLTALFVPADRREILFTLYAFNHELARAREVASQPVVALIRLQWWREVVEGTEKPHEVATPLLRAVQAGALARPDLLAMIEGREAEIEPSIPDVTTWHGYLRGTGGALAWAAGRALGAPETAQDGLTACGAAYAAAGVLRSVPFLAGQERCLLPEDVLSRHGTSPEAVIAAPTAPPVLATRRDLAAEALRTLATTRTRLPRTAVAAALPAVLARRDLRRIDHPPAPRGLGDRLAVTVAGLTGRV